MRICDTHILCKRNLNKNNLFEYHLTFAKADAISLDTSADAESSMAAAVSGSQRGGGPGGNPRLILAAIFVVAVTSAALFLHPPLREVASSLFLRPKELLQSAPGFVESLTLIFMTELGDKTFFIAALLAMRLGKTIAWFGSTSALAIMTVISVGIGRAFAQIPQFVDQSAVSGQYIGAVLLAYFGIRSLASGLKKSKQQDGDGELQEAEEEMEEAERTGKIGKGRSWMSAFGETASLIFIAEWGDRSMLATIALAIKSSPVGVTLGATAGHALATLIAVITGAIASKYISEKVVEITGGVLFLLFALETGLGLGIL